MAKGRKKNILKGIFEPVFLCTHPISCGFESWTIKWQNRTLLSIVLAIITSLFSRIETICSQDKCISYFFEALFNIKIVSQQQIIQNILISFGITAVFFFMLWMIVLSIAIWVHVRRFTHELIIPIVFSFLIIFILGVSSGTFPQLFLETRAIDCVSGDDCIKAGY
jgi:hypothetical protein